MNCVNAYIECRTCLGKFSDDVVHVETKVTDQKNVLQAIEEVASIKVIANDGLPKQICKNCFKSLESSINFRKQVISSHIELERRLLTGINYLNDGIDPLLLPNKNPQEQDDNKHVKEENKEPVALLVKEHIPLEVQTKSDNNKGSQASEKDNDSDWNGLGDRDSSSDDTFHEQLHRKPSLRKSRPTVKKDKTDLNTDKNSANKKNSSVPLNEEIDFRCDNNVSDDVGNDKTKTLNHINSKLSVLPEKEWSDLSDSSDSFCSDKGNKEEKSSKTRNKKTALVTRKIRRKRRISKKPLSDISDTSESNSDSDIPLEELRKEIRDLENKTEPKVRKKREKKENVDGPRLCPICGKLFKARQNFNSHMTTVHRKKPDKPEKISCLCPDCGRVITGTRQNFVAHRRYHHSDKAQVKKRFTCDVCPRKFYREKNLIIHQRIHKGEKGYVCELCPDKSYTQIGGLILHKRKVHLKKPTCTCNYCGKQFYEKHYLETHIRQWHTGERPFSCEICGKSFSCNGTLLRHRKDSHGEKQPCPKCGKMYTEGELRKHLKRHKIREEGIKRKKYTCEYCGTEMNFTSRKRHLLKQHGIMLRGRGETAERVPISRADAM